MKRLIRVFVMIGISATLYQIIGDTLPINHAMLLVGASCGVAYAILSEVE